jgi:hypothetical protein
VKLALSSDRLEQWSAALLAAATLATAFSAYEATRWSGQQSTRYTQAGAARTKAATNVSEGYSLVTIDATLFTQIATAYSDDNQKLVKFLRERLRTEFKPVFDEWVDQEPLTNPEAKPTPFQLPSYEPETLVEAEKFDAEADQLFEEGREANQTSDNYVLATIFFAAVLFFAGLATKFRSRPVITGSLFFATAVFLAGVARLATLPFL